MQWLCLGAAILASWNSPYPDSDEQASTLYGTFVEEPNHLDPARAYGGGAYPLLYQIVEPPFQYHFLKRPYTVAPLTAMAVPRPETRSVTWQGRTLEATVYSVRIQPGIRYQDHPCFVEANRRLTAADVAGIRSVEDFRQTATRELLAADYLHAIRRLADPRLSCPILPTLEQNILGMREYSQALASALDAARQRRREAAGPLYNQQQDEKYNPIRLDYEAYDLPGVRSVDSHAFEVVLLHPYPQILYWMILPFFAPVPPEAIEFFDQPVLLERSIVFDRNIVGTGPYRLGSYDPTNQIILERNENFRDERYPDLPEPAAGDARARAVYDMMRSEGMLDDVGKPLPMIDRVVFRMEREWIPRWNKFLQGYYDSSDISSDIFDQAVTLTSQGDATLSDEMSRNGIRLLTTPALTVYYFAFNMNDPVVGGYGEKQRKLRQAISIAFDVEEEVGIFLNGRGIPAHSPIPPQVFGYEEGEAGVNLVVYRWDGPRSRPVRRSLDEAKRLLAEAGYPDGYGPDGAPLVVTFDNAWVAAANRPHLRFVAKQFAKLGIRLDARTSDFNRLWDKIQSGNYQVLSWGWLADYPDPENFLFLLYGPNSRSRGGSENNANYANPEFDRLFAEMRNMENTPQRLAIIRQMNRIAQDDAPWIFGYYPIAYSLVHEWLGNAYPHAMNTNILKYRKIDTALRAQRRREWNAPRWTPIAVFAAVLVAAGVPAVWAAVRRAKEA
ncbi:MAG TPA: ABC transporter substrate-binding protein [Phycisphaerae bacterium]|nr:ABC transporter substrate-binding protein [Phycisphaerae bacterium]